MKSLPFLLIVNVFLFWCNNVFASCFYTYDNTYVTQTVNLGTAYVQRDTPVGSTVLTATVTVGNRTDQLYQCQEALTWETILGLFVSPSSLGSGIYNTNIKGIGIRITDTFRNLVAPTTRTNAPLSAVGNTPFKIELIKTSVDGVDAGNLNTGALVYMKSDNDGVTFAQLNLIGVNQIVPVACSVRTPNLTFPIGDILSSYFGNTVGLIPSGAQNTQYLGLDCDAKANINVSLQGTQNPDVSTTSVLALTGQGNADVAKGVGVQLLYNGTPLILNNRIVLKQSAGGQETFPITARYYQTKTSVSTGKANASATLDLTYQ